MYSGASAGDLRLRLIAWSINGRLSDCDPVRFKIDILFDQSCDSSDGILAGLLGRTHFPQPRETLAKSNRKSIESIAAIGISFSHY